MPIRLAIAILVFVGACVACVPVSVTSSSFHPVDVVDTCDPTDFTSRITVISPSMPGQQLTQAMQSDLGSAYCNAPRTFRRQLDNIDFVFVDATQCTGGDINKCDNLNINQVLGSSWGLRNKGGYTQIGISAGLWPPGQPAMQYPAFESAILASLPPWKTMASPPHFDPPSNNPPNNANTSWMTVLAALAHEAGHVRFFEANVRAGFSLWYDFKRLNNCNFFVGWANQNDDALKPAGRWRNFGDTSNVAANDHAAAPKLGDFPPGGSQDLTNLAALLSGDQPGVSQPWASYLAADAPDEDFVETYKFAILIDAGLTSLPMTITTAAGPVPVNVPDDYLAQPTKKKALTKKIRCIRRWV